MNETNTSVDHPLTMGGNPLRERRVIVRRYARNAVVGLVLLAMAWHIFVVATDWTRIGGLANVLSTTAEFLPNLAFFPRILDPLLETLLIAFWGTTLAMTIAMPVAYLAARNVTPCTRPPTCSPGPSSCCRARCTS